MVLLEKIDVVADTEINRATGFSDRGEIRRRSETCLSQKNDLDLIHPVRCTILHDNPLRHIMI